MYLRPFSVLRPARLAAELSILLTATLVSVAGAAPPRAARQSSPTACTARSRSGPSAAQTAVPFPAVYVAENCVPEPAWLTPWGDALSLPATAWTPQHTAAPIVLPSGNAYAVIPSDSSAPGQLVELPPAGKVMWSTPDTVGDMAIVGDPQVVAVVGGYSSLIVDTADHVVTQVNFAFAQAGQNGDANPQTIADVVGKLVIFETSLSVSMGEGQPPTPGVVDVYNGQGKRVRQFSLPDHPPQANPDIPFDAALIQTAGNTAYILYTDYTGDYGDQAGLFTLTAANQLSGPFRIPYEDTDATGHGSLEVLPGPSVLVSGWQFGGDQQAALFRLTHGHLIHVWDRSWSTAAPLVYGGTYLVANRSPNTESGPGPSTLQLLNWRTGRPLAGGPVLHDQNMALKVLAAAPSGVLAVADSTAYACQITQCASDLVFLELNGRKAWSVPLPAQTAARATPITAQPAQIGGYPALLLGPPGLGVVWGGALTLPGSSSWPDFASPVATSPTVPVRGPIAAYVVQYQGNPVDEDHPLVVSAASAKQPIPLTVSALGQSAASEPVPSAALVSLSDGGAGGRLSSINGFDQVVIPAGQSSTPFTYTPPKAGSYVITAEPGGSGGELHSDLTPLAPSRIPVGSAFEVVVTPWDANGVPDPLPVGAILQIVSQGSDVSGSPATAAPQRNGLYVATLRTGRDPNRVIQLSTAVYVTGQPYAALLGETRASVVQAPVPSALEISQTKEDELITIRPVKGSHPIGYAVYRMTSAPNSQADLVTAPYEVIDPASAFDPSATVAVPAAADYQVAAIYASGSVSLPSPLTGPAS